MGRFILGWVIVILSSSLKIDSSFTDVFHTDGESMWKTSDWLHCVEGHCVKMSTANIAHRIHQRGTLQISFRNDCDSEYDCCQDGFVLQCTPYTTGQVLSRGHFGYGSFRWIADAISDQSENLDEDDSVEVLACFTLENHHHTEISFVIGICISSFEPTVARTELNIGPHIESERHQLGFDPSEQSAVYRIDFTPSGIKYFVNGALLREIKNQDGVHIPVSEKVKIGISMFQAITASPEPIETLDTLPRSRIEIVMTIFRVRYIQGIKQTANLDPHDELFVIGNSSSYSFVFLMGVLGIILMILAFILFANHKYFFQRVQGDYFLFENPDCVQADSK